MPGIPLKTVFPDRYRDRTAVLAGWLAIVLAAAEVILDLGTWVELDIATIYGIPLVLAAFARNRRLLVALTIVLVLALNAVSHDIRNPVNTINLMAELIRRSAEVPALAPQVPQMAERLQANAQSLVAPVSEVLDAAHLDSGLLQRHGSTFSLNEFVDAKCSGAPLAEAKSLSRCGCRPITWWTSPPWRSTSVESGHAQSSPSGRCIKPACARIDVTMVLSTAGCLPWMPFSCRDCSSRG